MSMATRMDRCGTNTAVSIAWVSAPVRTVRSTIRQYRNVAMNVPSVSWLPWSRMKPVNSR